MSPIVQTNLNYNSDIMGADIRELKAAYPFLETGIIGKSILGRDIPYIRLGKGRNQVCYTAAIHANEWITAVLLMRFVEKYAEAYKNGTRIYGYSIREVFTRTSIYIVPMCNPDGVDLVTGRIKEGTRVYRNAEAISRNYPTIRFPSGWKANILGVDLNLQFPAGWREARRIKFAQGYTRPAPRDFVGEGPLTEPEALALYNFTLSHNFRLILAYHTQGETIYWKYLNRVPPQSIQIGEMFARISGYTLESTPYSSGFAGYKDWFIQDYNRPGYTIEVGTGINPLPLTQLDSIYRKNEGILVTAAMV